jgi:peptidoglycan hydrolase-like protein with peptidoglycan-binding domain
MTKKLTDKQIYVGAFTAIALGGYLVYRFVTKETYTLVPNTGNDTGNAVVNSGGGSSVPKDTNVQLGTAKFPLKNGSKGTNVQILQSWLNDTGDANPKLIADGIFGGKTADAVKNMQNRQIKNSKYVKQLKDKKQLAIGEVTQDFYDVFITKTKTLKTTSPAATFIKMIGY